MKTEYFFRIVKYESGPSKCYYVDHEGAWRVTGLTVPYDLERRGLTVSVEEITEKEHKESIKNDEPKRVRDTRKKKTPRA